MKNYHRIPEVTIPLFLIGLVLSAMIHFAELCELRDHHISTTFFILVLMFTIPLQLIFYYCRWQDRESELLDDHMIKEHQVSTQSSKDKPKKPEYKYRLVQTLERDDAGVLQIKHRISDD